MLPEENRVICNAHADLLSKYENMFPTTFIDSVRAGVSWLCSHNGLTYQTSTMLKTDNVVYSSDSSILKIGLIDVERPLSGISYYDVKKVTEAVDNVSGKTTFNVELNYKTPIGIKVTLIPFKYFDPVQKPDKVNYTKQEIDAKLQEINEKIDNIKIPEIPEIPEPVTVDLSTYVRILQLGNNYNVNETLFYNGTLYNTKVEVQNVQEADLTDTERFNVVYQPPVVTIPEPSITPAEQLYPEIESVEVVCSTEFKESADDEKVPSVKAVKDFINEMANTLTAELANKADISDLETKANREELTQTLTTINTKLANKVDSQVLTAILQR